MKNSKLLRVTKQTDDLLIIKSKTSGLSKCQLIEFAVINLPPIKKTGKR